MSKNRLSSYLVTHRKKWGLNQSELGALLGLSRQAISNYELEIRPVPAELIVASELLFGEPFFEVFPAFSEAIEDDIGARALALEAKLLRRTDAKSLKKLALLSGIPGRVRFAPDA
jgi:transcriptional regulator with XRE-family HTH domain